MGGHANLKESLRRIALTGIESENAFYSKGEDRLITDSFSPLVGAFLRDDYKEAIRDLRARGTYASTSGSYGRSITTLGLDTNFYGNSLPLSHYRLVDHKIRDSQNGLKWEADLFELQRQLPWPNTLTPRR